MLRNVLDSSVHALRPAGTGGLYLYANNVRFAVHRLGPTLTTLADDVRFAAPASRATCLGNANRIRLAQTRLWTAKGGQAGPAFAVGEYFIPALKRFDWLSCGSRSRED